jgi:GNAT superfamily N-acetyltransferase
MKLQLNKIVDFIQKYAPQYKDRELIKEYITLHLEYKTFFVVYDGEEVAAVCRWNIDGGRATILDFYVREDWRNKDLIRQLLQKGLWLFPQVMEIGFERGMRDNDKGIRFYKVSKILKRR